MSLMSTLSTHNNMNMWLISFQYTAQIRTLNVFGCMLLSSESEQFLKLFEVTQLLFETVIIEAKYIL